MPKPQPKRPQRRKRTRRAVVRTPEFCERAEALYQSLGSIAAVAEELDTDAMTVSRAISEGPVEPLLLRRKREREEAEQRKAKRRKRA